MAAAGPASARASAVAAPDAQALASQLTELTFPAETIRGDSLKAFAQNFRASYLGNPQARAAHERMPGLLDAMLDAGSAKLDETLVALLPEMKASISASYSQGLSAAELEKAVAFYSSPTGKKLVAATAAMAGGADLRAILSPAELSDFAKFSRSSAGTKIEAMKPRQTSEMANAVNHILSAAQPQISAAALEAGQAYLRAQPR